MAIFNTNLVQITGLTGDGAWHLKDLSGAPWSLPATASGVMLIIRNTDASTQTYGFRKPGSADSRTGTIVSKAQYTAFVGLNANREISYYLSDSDVQVWLAGYFELDAVFFDNGIQQSIVQSGQWNIIDLSAVVPVSAKFVILEVIDISESTNEFGAQPGGGGPNDIRNPIKYHLWAIVSLDASRQYDLYGNSGSHQVFLMGYVTGGSQKQNVTPDITPAGSDSFEDIDLTSNTPPPRVTGAIVLLDWYLRDEHAEKRYAIRKNGSTDDWTTNTELRGLVYYPVGIDGGDIFEIKIDDVTVHQEMWLMGFLADPLMAAPLEATTSMIAGINASKVMAPLEAIASMEANVIVEQTLILSMSPPELLMTGSVEPYDFNPPYDVVGSLSLELIPPSLSMSGFVLAQGTLVLAMPLPSLVMSGDQSFVPKYIKGIAMNMTHYAVSEYVGYDFNSLTYFNGKFIGGNERGIFSFGDDKDDKDDGLNINMRMKMPVLDAYESIIKKARDAWLTCRTDGKMILVVQLGEDQFYDDFFEPTDTALQYRWKFPKGFKERFIAFELRNVDGSDCDINNLRFTTDAVPGRRK